MRQSKPANRIAADTANRSSRRARPRRPCHNRQSMRNPRCAGLTYRPRTLLLPDLARSYCNAILNAREMDNRARLATTAPYNKSRSRAPTPPDAGRRRARAARPCGPPDAPGSGCIGRRLLLEGLEAWYRGDEKMMVAGAFRNVARRAAPLVLAMAGILVATAVAALPQADPQDRVRGFYAVLLSTMKNGRSLGESGRYQALAPVVNNLFDVPSMARLAVGPAWDGLTAAQRDQITAAF